MLNAVLEPSWDGFGAVLERFWVGLGAVLGTFWGGLGAFFLWSWARSSGVLVGLVGSWRRLLIFGPLLIPAFVLLHVAC